MPLNVADGMTRGAAGNPVDIPAFPDMADRLRNLEARVAVLETAARSRDDELLVAELKSLGLL